MPNKNPDNLLRSHGIDPEDARFRRARLDCAPPHPVDIVNRKMAKLDRLIDHIHSLHAEADELIRELLGMGIAAPTYGFPPEEIFYDEWDTWHWRDGEWGYSEPGTDYYKYLAEFTTRPQKRQDIEAWNRFLMAYERPPITMYRVRVFYGCRYVADFHDANGRLIRLCDPLIRPSIRS